MATRAAKGEPVDWRAAFRRAMSRALQMAGGAALYAFTGFLALALISFAWPRRGTPPRPAMEATG